MSTGGSRLRGSGYAGSDRTNAPPPHAEAPDGVASLTWLALTAPVRPNAVSGKRELPGRCMFAVLGVGTIRVRPTWPQTGWETSSVHWSDTTGAPPNRSPHFQGPDLTRGEIGPIIVRPRLPGSARRRSPRGRPGSLRYQRSRRQSKPPAQEGSSQALHVRSIEIRAPVPEEVRVVVRSRGAPQRPQSTRFVAALDPHRHHTSEDRPRDALRPARPT